MARLVGSLSSRQTYRRVLVTAASSRLGKLVVDELESLGSFEVILAVDSKPPTLPFEQAEFVLMDDDFSQIGRVCNKTGLELVIDLVPLVAFNELNEGRLRRHPQAVEALVSGCSDGNSVQKIVSVGSVYRYGWDHKYPRFISEDTKIVRRPVGTAERAFGQIETKLFTAAKRLANQTGKGRRAQTLDVSCLRVTDVVGLTGIGVLDAAGRLPVVPTVLGCDPPIQVVHEEDLAKAVAFAATHRIPSLLNVAADGTIPVSELLTSVGRSAAPLLPPWGLRLLAALITRTGVPFTNEIAGQVRFGRGIDNRLLKSQGFSFSRTGRESLTTVTKAKKSGLIGAGTPSAYQPDVEAFLKYSPAVHSAEVVHEDIDVNDPMSALDPESLISVLPSLQNDALMALRAHELAGPNRRRILDEIDLLLRK